MSSFHLTNHLIFFSDWHSSTLLSNPSLHSPKPYRSNPISIHIAFARTPLSIRAFREEQNKAAMKAQSDDLMDTITVKATEIADDLTAKWEASDEKPTIIFFGFSALLALYFTNGIVGAVDKLPLLSTIFELIGMGFTGYTAYRFFLVPGEKETITSTVSSFAKKVGIDL